jgi:Mn2+/Fe2+ NRAMP family transporter
MQMLDFKMNIKLFRSKPGCFGYSINPVFYGAAFLMATSAIGPGFLTSTAVFTSRLFASFGFAILISIVVDLIAQLNVWRIITVTNLPAQDIANLLLPGLGSFLSLLIISGGLVFNIGNIAGCGLGLNVLFGMDITTGALISAGISILLFLLKDAGKAMDRFAQVLGFLMIGLVLYVAISSQPPIAEALYKTIIPDQIDFMSIVTIVGGTVGGYITYAGAHRRIDAGISGVDNKKQVDKSAFMAIGIASLMRILLFLAALGVVMKGSLLDEKNPAASVFQLAAGNIGYKIFGMVLWAASVTSVVGASFTSVTFARSFHPWLAKKQSYAIIAFIVCAALLFALFGKPIKVLIFAGAFNGFILAFSLGIMLIAATKSRIMKGYQHPRAYLIAGSLVALLILVFGTLTILHEFGKK